MSSEEIRNQRSFGKSEVVKEIRKLRTMADKLIFPVVCIFSLHIRIFGLISLQTF